MLAVESVPLLSSNECALIWVQGTEAENKRILNVIPSAGEKQVVRDQLQHKTEIAPHASLYFSNQYCPCLLFQKKALVQPSTVA